MNKLLGIILIFILTGCAFSANKIKDNVESTTDTGKSSSILTEIPSETPTIHPTHTITATFQPTHTRSPTKTPEPTKTLTPIPTPVLFSGNGDSIIDFINPEPALVHIIGNAAGRYFSVTNYDRDNTEIRLLVNTTDSYDGIRPLDFLDTEDTARFQVQADGAWTIEILPLASIDWLTIPGDISGNGDYVFALRGDEPDIATIKGNGSGRYFGIFAYTKAGIDLLVNTTEPYEGMVMLDRSTWVIEIIAEDEWTIKITTH